MCIWDIHHTLRLHSTQLDGLVLGGTCSVHYIDSEYTTHWECIVCVPGVSIMGTTSTQHTDRCNDPRGRYSMHA